MFIHTCWCSFLCNMQTNPPNYYDSVWEHSAHQVSPFRWETSIVSPLDHQPFYLDRHQPWRMQSTIKQTNIIESKTTNDKTLTFYPKSKTFYSRNWVCFLPKMLYTTCRSNPQICGIIKFHDRFGIFICCFISLTLTCIELFYKKRVTEWKLQANIKGRSYWQIHCLPIISIDRCSVSFVHDKNCLPYYFY